MFRLSIIVILLIVLSACAPVLIRPVKKNTKFDEHYYDKSYNIGTRKTAFVGDEIVKVKDYYIFQTTSEMMKSINDFEINYTSNSDYYDQYSDKGKLSKKIKISKGTELPILGMVNRGGIEIFIISTNNIRIGIDETGNFTGLILDRTNYEIKEYTIYPENITFESVVYEEIDSKRSFVNFEIIFTGTTEESINLLYREYTPGDMAKPAFYQNLTYPRNTEKIRFKEIQIEVHKVTNEQIEFTVLEDGTNY